MIVEYFVVILLILWPINGHPAEDEILDLPGLDFPINFLQYSGYLNGTEGRYLHYWFTENARPTETPLILWLNGGPGCSSIFGLLTENGPFLINEDGTVLEENPYGWNTVGNVLYLESPACVGFSYDDNSTCGTSDNETAESNYLALQHFFLKFPEYRDRDFYIAGESYAGIYIPTLAVKIVDGNDTYPVNLKGFAIGNGLTSYENNENSRIFFGRYHALIGNDLWTRLVSYCCGGIESKNTCDFYLISSSLDCEAAIFEAIDVLYHKGINQYNIYKDCETSAAVQKNRYSHNKMIPLFNSKIQYPETYSELPCTDSSAASNYLNTPDVRTALHIPDTVQPWEVCSDAVLSNYLIQVFNTSSLLRTLHDNNIRGVLYNGDVDMVINFLGNQWDITDLGYAVVENRRQWDLGGQVAGYVTKYDLLDFVTVRGSGHMVPSDKPPEALKIISSFVNNEPY